MTFYLYENCAPDEKDRSHARLVLDDQEHKDWTLIKTIEAPSWIDARETVYA